MYSSLVTTPHRYFQGNVIIKKERKRRRKEDVAYIKGNTLMRGENEKDDFVIFSFGSEK